MHRFALPPHSTSSSSDQDGLDESHASMAWVSKHWEWWMQKERRRERDGDGFDNTAPAGSASLTRCEKKEVSSVKENEKVLS